MWLDTRLPYRRSNSLFFMSWLHLWLYKYPDCCMDIWFFRHVITSSEFWGSLGVTLPLNSFEIWFSSASVCIAMFMFESKWKCYLIVKELFIHWFVLMSWLYVLLFHKIRGYSVACSTWHNFLIQAFILPVDTRSSKNSTEYNLYPTNLFVVGGCWTYTESWFYRIAE